ncbi:M81 family metallopeptidase [Rhizobium leguminosarum]
MGFRVALIEFSHEGNTFTIRSTPIEAFHASRYFQGAEIVTKMRGTNSEIGGALDLAEERGWEVVPILAAHAQPGGTVTEAARRTITADVVRDLEAAGRIDGIFVALHGAMVTETSEDGESQFLAAIRSVVGADLPIAVTLDLHANIFDAMAGLADIAVSFRTYPHIDMRERGREACTLLHAAMAGETVLRLLVARPPMLVGCDDGRTTEDGPMCRLLEDAAREMMTPGILNVSVNAGFTDADVWAAGPSVLVNYDARIASTVTAQAVADRICARIWDFRDDWARPIPLRDCIARLKAQKPTDKPIVVADFSDNPGSGGYGDSTTLLSALLDAGLGNIALGVLYDPEAADLLASAGVGAECTILLGGKTDPGTGGGPIEVTGTVAAISDGAFTFEGPMFTGLPGTLGRSVSFQVGGIEVLIASENQQMLDANIFRALGIEPAAKTVLAVKSMHHFRGAFAPLASEILVTDAGGLCSPDLTRRSYRNIRRPIFPLDPING